jgi:hypothetical protein
VGLHVCVVMFSCEWKGNGCVGVCYYLVRALRIDSAKMCAVDGDVYLCLSWCGCVRLGCCVLSVAIVFLLLSYGNYVSVTRCLEFSWYFNAGA